MQKKLYCICDAKAEMYNDPWSDVSAGSAERQFAMLVRDPKTTISQFPEGFDLYELGTFDTNTGKILAHETPRHIIKATDPSLRTQ